MADAQVNALLRELDTVNGSIDTLEAGLKVAKKRKEELETTLLPEAFASAGIGNEYTTADGIKAIRGLMATGSLPKDPEKRATAIKWLEDNGYVDLISTEVVGKWTKGDHDKAVAAYNQMRGDNSATVTKKEDVHHKTLGALAVQCVREGKPIDLEALGVVVLTRVKITKGTDNGQ